MNARPFDLYDPKWQEGEEQPAGTAPANPWASRQKPLYLLGPQAPAARAATPVATAAPMVGVGPGPAPAPAARPFDDLMALAGLQPARQPYTSPASQQFLTKPQFGRIEEATGPGPLRIEVPAAPPVAGQPQWQPANAPGFAPVITPEMARPLAAPEPFRLAPEAPPAAAAPAVPPAFTPADELGAHEALKPFFGEKQRLEIVARAKGGNEEARQKIAEARARFDAAAAKKEAGEQVTIAPGTPSGGAEFEGGFLQYKGAPAVTIPKAQLPIARTNYEQSKQLAMARVSDANRVVTEVQKRYDAGQADETELAAAKAQLGAAISQRDAVFKGGLAGVGAGGTGAAPAAPAAASIAPVTAEQRAAQKAAARLGSHADQMAKRVDELMFGKYLPNAGIMDPTSPPLIPGVSMYRGLEAGPNWKPSYGALSAETLNEARRRLATEFGPGRTKATPEDVMTSATHALVVWMVKHRNQAEYKGAIEEWAKKNPVAWKTHGSLIPMTDEMAPTREPVAAPPAAAAPQVGGNPPLESTEVISPDNPRHFSQATSAANAVPPPAPGTPIPPDRAMAYLLKHNRDRAKAEAAALADGWTVPKE